MFLGEYTHTIDNKNRLAVPVKFRKELMAGAVLTRGLDNCLFLYPKQEWDKLAERLSKLPISQANTRAFARLMLAGAWELEFDKQGRIFLPNYLKSFAQIKKKVVIAGLFNRLEIWDEDVWRRYKEGTEKSSKDIAEALGELGV